jgi:hypothetical protein
MGANIEEEENRQERLARGAIVDLVKSKEQPNQSGRKNQSECGEGGKVVYFVEVFLIVSLMFHENVKKIYRGQKIVRYFCR